jgi:hypothetical protein
MEDKSLINSVEPAFSSSPEVEIKKTSMNHAPDSNNLLVQDHVEEHSWILFFSFASWLTITIIFLSGIYKDLLISADQSYPAIKNDSKIRTVIIDQKSIIQQTAPDKEYFLSDKNNMGSGIITEKKGFEAISKSRELRFGNEPEMNEDIAKTFFFKNS